jgi:hypothetical protein
MMYVIKILCVFSFMQKEYLRKIILWTIPDKYGFELRSN